MPYEEDGIAKAGKILFMQQSGHIFSPLAGQNFYHDEMFSLYYMALACVHAIFRGNAFYEMNMASAVAGGVFCGLVSAVLRRIFSIPVWLTALLALNTPAFLHVFSFGNEAAFALAAFALAFLLLTAPTFLKSALAGIVFGLGFHCRPDIVFLAPFLLAWVWLRVETRPAAVKMCLCFGCAAGLCALGFWLLFVRRMPTETGFPMSFVPQYFAGILFYPFAPALIPAALFGAWRLMRTRRRDFAALLLALIPLIYCARNLSSSKYIAILMLPLWILAGTALIQSGWRVRALTAGLAVVFWTCSITPFGLHAGLRGATWFFPTDHGPIPTGSYAWFYSNVHQGVYQQRRASEIKEVRRLLRRLDEKPGEVVVGFFNGQTVLFAQAERFHYDEVLRHFPWQQTSAPTDRPCLMIKTSYMRMNTLDAASQKNLRRWFAAGEVRALTAEAGDPFPDVIETGGQIPSGENVELGRRILFALDSCRDTGYVQRNIFNPDLNATRWFPANEKIPTAGAPVYADHDFAAYTNDVVGGVIYGSLMPLRYYGLKDPRFNSGFSSTVEGQK